MRRIVISILLCANLAGAQDAAPRGKWKRILFRVSQAALAAGNGADAFTSMGRQEINPVLGRGRFTGGQIAIKAAIVGGIMLGQEIVVRKLPAVSPAFAVSNFAMAGYLGWRAKANLGFPKVGAVQK
ncbi:MAG: hypothetical protein WBY44_01420 [Bryobacteraceae bacterium]|jgi:hypothetical protein